MAHSGIDLEVPKEHLLLFTTLIANSLEQRVINIHAPQQIENIDKTPARIFYAKNPPLVSITDYLNRIVKYGFDAENNDYTCCTLLFLTLCILNRYLKVMHESLNSLNVHRLLITSFVVTLKSYTESIYNFNNARMAHLGGLPLQELNKLERNFYSALGFNLQIGYDELTSTIEAFLEVEGADNTHQALMEFFKKMKEGYNAQTPDKEVGKSEEKEALPRPFFRPQSLPSHLAEKFFGIYYAEICKYLNPGLVSKRGVEEEKEDPCFYKPNFLLGISGILSKLDFHLEKYPVKILQEIKDHYINKKKEILDNVTNSYLKLMMDTQYYSMLIKHLDDLIKTNNAQNQKACPAKLK